jgi:hypothetical protein
VILTMRIDRLRVPKCGLHAHFGTRSRSILIVKITVPSTRRRRPDDALLADSEQGDEPPERDFSRHEADEDGDEEVGVEGHDHGFSGAH